MLSLVARAACNVIPARQPNTTTLNFSRPSGAKKYCSRRTLALGARAPGRRPPATGRQAGRPADDLHRQIMVANNKYEHNKYENSGAKMRNTRALNAIVA